MIQMVTVSISVFIRYVEYTWQGIKQRWQSRHNLGFFKMFKGFVVSFIESFFLVKMDIRDGYL